MDPTKISVIMDWPCPTNVKEVQVNYYHCFINNFTKLAKPLSCLARRNVPFPSVEPLQHAFLVLKKAFANASI